MKVRQTDVSQADKASAQVFFDALFGFFDIGQGRVLDAFARNGQLTVSSYAKRVPHLTCWELGPEHEEALRKFTSDVVIGDSYKTLMAEGRTFDLVVIDTPQGIHADSRGTKHVEHWDFLEYSLQNLVPGGVVVLYVNKSPYNRDELGTFGYDEYKEYDYKSWMKAREEYYGSSVITEEQAIQTYREVLADMDRKMGRVLMVPCFSDVPGLEPYAFRLGFEVLG